MKKNEVKVGGFYTAKVSDKLVKVRIDSTHSGGGWNATNTATGKGIRIKSAQRLRGAARKTPKTQTPKAANTIETAVRSDLAARGDEKAGSREGTEAMVVNDEKAGTPGVAVADDDKARAASKTAAKKAKSRKAKADPRVPVGQKPKRVSALDAAAQVLAKAGKPMRAQELIAAMAERGLWSSPAGKTPHATLYAAMMREARDKGTASRFCKVDRGQFAFSDVARSS